MTLKKAIERYKSNAEYERIHGNLQGCLDFRQLEEWLKDYKRLLEQESILDKIKAEIDAQIDMYDTPCEIDGGIDESFCNGLNKAKKIIDKYKAESEK